MAAFAVDSDEAKQWMEGGDSRAELQVVGGALIGGLGGGSVFTAVGGGLGAGLSSKSADQTRAVADAVTDATGSSLVGNISSNILAGVGGALVGGTAGAAAASNVDLYNRNNDLGNDQAKKDLAASQNVIASYLQNNLPSWITGPLDSANKTVDGWAAQFKAKMDGDALAIMSQPPTTQMARGAANGLSAGVVEGGEPPAPSAGGVLVNSSRQAANAVSGTPNAVSGTPGYVPDNTTLSKGSDNSTPSPVLSDDPYNPSNVDARVKPTYQTNPAHDTSSPLYNPNKTPEPADAQSAYEDGAVLGGMGTWYAQGETGYYQYFSDSAGTVHFSGTIPASKVPPSVLKILGK
ncbi:hypothetical protein P3T42_002961 [Paraburkholderia sp. GAS38]|uniref:hypothetical protein n=1 Tax=Paraburkholderia sp. GAS38 TaxID=3035133 RepID=UPI003D236C5F